MKKLFSLVFIVAAFTACHKNPITGRNQVALFPKSYLQQTPLTEYKSFLSQNQVVSQTTSKDAEMVRRVGTRIAKAISDYYTQQGKPEVVKELADYKWEFNLVNNKEVNAWCMPGGKVVVYTGLLPITQTETALAIVLGHEITHAVAGHGRERMSQQMLAQGIEVAGNVALGSNPSTVNIFNQVYGPA